MERVLRRLWPLIAVGGLLVAALVAAALATPSISTAPPISLNEPERSPFELPQLSGPSTTPSGAAASSAARPLVLPGVVNTVAKAFCIVLAVVVVAFLIFMYLRSSLRNRRIQLLASKGAAGQRTRRDEVIAAVDAGLSDLDDDDQDPRRAVIACWVRLEQAAAAAGTPREPGDTPTDLIVRLLSAHQVSARVLYPLADVYRLARYATHTVDLNMRTQARMALRQVRAELMVSRSGPLEQVP